jgi:nucleotide sugar dehydrogenase
MAFFAEKGIRAIGHDISSEKVETINRGDYIIDDLKAWLDFPVKPLVRKGLMEATIDHMDLAKKDVLVHFIAIPTEKGGRPYFVALKNVIKNISQVIKSQRDPHKPLVIVESTLSPRASDAIVIPSFREFGIEVGRDILYGVAPRRDWFVDGGKNLSELDRVFGGYDELSSKRMQEVLGIVCKKLHRASNCYVSEMVKSFENAYRHMEITLANQISLAYPSRNIREALELAGTKWNIGTFRPGFGTGGYCIPLSSRYVIDGAEKHSELSILKETIKTDRKINILIAKSMIRKGLKKIAVLGLSYKGNLKVSTLSPTIPFINTLVKRGIDVRVFDPYFSDKEIKRIVNVPTFRFPEGMRYFDGVVLVVGHDEYDLPKDRLLRSVGRCKFILDNVGFWAKYKEALMAKGIEYHLAGDQNWL